jgi:hypothetical protein
VSFLAPWALLLGAAVGVPLLLHLLRRRTGETIQFPAVRYLLRMEREHAREVRLKNLILMVLRVAIILALAFAAARPIGRLPGLGHPPTAVAILLDNSLSSAAADADGPVLARLTAAARSIAEQASATDRLWLVTMDGVVIGGDRTAILDALSRVQPLDGAGDAQGALRRSAALVGESGTPNARIVLLTDGQSTTWTPVVPPEAMTAAISVVAVDGAARVNRAVTAVATEPLHWNPRGAVRATVAGGDSVTWRVIVDGRTVGRGSARSGATLLARVQTPARGWVAGAVELAPDELRGDDLRHFAAHVGEPPAVTVDAGSGPFLRGAVDALVQGGRAVRGTGVLLASAERAQRPGLLFAPSDPVKVADANRALDRAGVPWRFGARREGPAPLQGEGVEGAVARNWHVLTPAGDVSGADTLARVGAAPWAVAGDGYVLVASAAEANATDLTVRAAFVPWLDVLLSQWLAQGSVGAVEVAPGRVVRVPAAVETMESPDGTTQPVTAGVTREAPWKAGVYFWRRGNVRVGALVVNAEAAESDLAHLTADSLATRLGGTPLAVAPIDVGRATFAAGGARVLDRTFLVLALLLLLAETLVARRSIPKTQEA